jgi:hypothetical protein
MFRRLNGEKVWDDKYLACYFHFPLFRLLCRGVCGNYVQFFGHPRSLIRNPFWPSFLSNFLRKSKPPPRQNIIHGRPLTILSLCKYFTTFHVLKRWTTMVPYSNYKKTNHQIQLSPKKKHSP